MKNLVSLSLLAAISLALLGCKTVPSLRGAADLDPVDFVGGLAGTWAHRSGKDTKATIVIAPSTNKNKPRHYDLWLGQDGKSYNIAEFKVYRLGKTHVLEAVGRIEKAGGMAGALLLYGLAVPTASFCHLRAFGSPSVTRVEIRPPNKKWFTSRIANVNGIVVADGKRITHLLKQAAAAPDDAFDSDTTHFVRLSKRYDKIARKAAALSNSKRARKGSTPRQANPTPQPKKTPQPKTRAAPIQPRPTNRGSAPKRSTGPDGFRGKLALPMVWIKPGTFKMGSAFQGGSANERPVHPVTLTRGFYMAKYETRQRDYLAVTGDNPSAVEGADLPVESLPWTFATWFCKVLTKRERAAGRIPAGWSYRLPTEAEWEYACRAGSFWAYSFGSRLRPRHANYHRKRVMPVGSFPANAWGLHDMHGNVAEYCADRRRIYTKRPRVDPFGEISLAEARRSRASIAMIMERQMRVVRGGSYLSAATYCRSGARASATEQKKDQYTGFRVVLSPTPAWLKDQ